MIKIWKKGDMTWGTIMWMVLALIVIVLCSLLAYSAYKGTGGILDAFPWRW
jgi:hypothetical protein